MLFPTGVFALFFATVFLVHWALVRGAPALVRPFLLLASLVFYGFWSVSFCAALIAVGLFTWAIGLRAAKGRGRGWLMLGVGGVLAWLFWFKYAGFVAREVDGALALLGLGQVPLLEIVLPVGISFFVFQGISYVVDVLSPRPAARLFAARRRCLQILLPASGRRPDRARRRFHAAARAPPRRDRDLHGMALLLILWGLFKKAIIANYLATGRRSRLPATPSAYGALDLLLAIYAYAVQIYCDFSAYSDIAIGVAALLGYHFLRNFDQPYRAHSLQDFWRRWHISLSSWLRDYLYIPLGGNRQGPCAPTST